MTLNEKPIRPFLRWIGGKQNLVKKFVDFVPSDYFKNTYFEPFLGAGSMFFALQPSKAVLSDINQHLIHCYKMIKKDHKKIHKYLQKLKNKSLKDYYYEIRDEYNKKINEFTIPQAARFIYLNRTCFNGIFRVNKSGFFNVPYGYKKNPYFPTLEELEVLSSILKKAKLYTFSYSEIISKVMKGDFVYLDPPYPPINGNSSFTHYTKERFGEEQQREVASFAQNLNKKGCNVMISNADTDKVRNLYSDWKIYTIEATRFITCKSEKYKVKELIIINYNP